MSNIKSILSLIILAVQLTACGQNNSDRLTLGKEQAQQVLKSALTDTTSNNVINSKTAIIKDSSTAITIAETILFDIYGKKNIRQQKPYEIYHLDNYWYLTGTIPKGSLGGTFLIILDDRNSQIIKITHGK